MTEKEWKDDIDHCRWICTECIHIFKIVNVTDSCPKCGSLKLSCCHESQQNLYASHFEKLKEKDKS